MQYTDQLPTDPLTITCYMTGDELANYTLYEDDGSTFKYQNGAYAQISINCRVIGDQAIVEIEERFEKYHPLRQWYELIVFVGGQVLKHRVQAGQSHIRVHIR